MNADHIYQTETMAELCARQGRIGEAIGIYRRLTDLVTDTTLRARLQRRLAVLEARWQPAEPRDASPADVPLPPAPGVALLIGDEQITVAWSLPLDAAAPTLDLLLLTRTPSGIESSKRTLPLPAPTGRLALFTPGIHSAAAAAGSLVGGRFIALARTPAGR
jgi:hypothetical protein